MAAYKATSWGRTRRPKTIAKSGGALTTTKESAVAVTVVTAAGQLASGLDSGDAGKNGFVTENQRFLHVYVEGAGTNSVDIYGYNYAFGAWALLMESQTGESGRIAMNAAVGSGAARQYKFFIAGVDRVAFVKKSATAPTAVYASVSSF